MLEISVCLIVKNEAANIRACLESIKDIADEIIVVDTGSTDSTIAICGEFTDKVYSHAWQDDFSIARNQSLSYATKDWILRMDADERLRPEDRERVKVLANWPQNRYLIFKLSNPRLCNHPRVPEPAYLQARMFPNHKGICFEGAIHEQFVESAIQADLVGFYVKDVVIEHYGYEDINEVERKVKRNDAIREKMTQPELV